MVSVNDSGYKTNNSASSDTTHLPSRPPCRSKGHASPLHLKPRLTTSSTSNFDHLLNNPRISPTMTSTTSLSHLPSTHPSPPHPQHLPSHTALSSLSPLLGAWHSHATFGPPGTPPSGPVINTFTYLGAANSTPLVIVSTLADDATNIPEHVRPHLPFPTTIVVGFDDGGSVGRGNFVALYTDARGVARVYGMRFGEEEEGGEGEDVRCGAQHVGGAEDVEYEANLVGRRRSGDSNAEEGAGHAAKRTGNNTNNNNNKRLVWRMWRAAEGMHQRFVAVMVDDRKEMVGRWEISEDGAAWKVDFGVRYVKVENGYGDGDGDEDRDGGVGSR